MSGKPYFEIDTILQLSPIQLLTINRYLFSFTYLRKNKIKWYLLYYVYTYIMVT